MADPYKHISPHVRYFISFISSINTHKEAEKTIHHYIYDVDCGRFSSNVWVYVGSQKRRALGLKPFRLEAYMLINTPHPSS